MIHKQYGYLLFDAIRETLENMAFAEVVSHSMLVGDEEFIEEIQNAGNALPAENLPGWQETSNAAFPEDDAWGAVLPTSEFMQNDGWGNIETTGQENKFSDKAWNNPLDSWGEAAQSETATGGTGFYDNKAVDFEQLIEHQAGWCWSCLKVNSPELDSVWFIVPQTLLQELAKTMYAGEEFTLDMPIVRDIIAELTNVIGGRLMLLLEETVGKFTLEVPETGFGIPVFPSETTHNETVVCKVLVDGAYPVLTTMCFRNDCPAEKKDCCLGHHE